MKTVILIYLLGVGITGIVASLLYDYNTKFRETRTKEYEEGLKNNFFEINMDMVIKTDIIITSLFSFIGLISLIAFFFEI